jgi:exosome complex RNA-binding protein Rrp4
MADLKISDLVSANVVNKDDLFYLVQDNNSFNVNAGTLFASITDPTLAGNIIVGGEVQTLNATGTVSITTARTDLYGGLSADANAIANGSVLPTTIFLYTEGVSATGRGLTFTDGTPINKTLYVRHKDSKIYLSAAQGTTYSYPPEDWIGPTGLRPFPTGLQFIKGSTYTFDVSDPSNTGNVISLSTSIDGTNTLGLEYASGVVKSGTPGTSGATYTFTVANVSIDQGGKTYLDIPRGVEGQLKVINLVRTLGGRFVISSNLQNNLAIELKKSGDSAFLMYSSNGWILVGSNPGLVTSFSGTSDDITEGNKLYFTNTRARAAITAGDTTIIYDTANGVIRANASFIAGLVGTVAFSGNTNAVSEGSLNLYYTNSRVRSNVISLLPTLAGTGISINANGIISASGNVTISGIVGLNTANVAESANNLYYTNARVYANISPLLTLKANVSDLTTSNVIEGSNLYFTNARVYANVIGLLNLKANVVDLTTANVRESASNLYYTNARVYANVIGLLNAKANVVDLTTANVRESGSNLYYTNARVYSNVIGFLPSLAGTGITIAANGQISASGNVTVSSLVGLNTANVAESDSNLYYTNARVYANVIGLLNAKANIVDLTTSNVVEGNNLYYTNARVRSNVIALLPTLAGTGIVIDTNGIISASGNVTISGIVGLNTANVAESANNLYYTNARVRSNVIALLPTLAGTGISIDANGIISASGNVTVSGIVGLNTANVAESASNLYYTNARVYANVISLLNAKANVVDLTTANVNEFGSNLYYTNARVYANVIGLLNAKANVVDLTTANVNEFGSNLYYTNARVRSNVIALLPTLAGTGISIDANGIISASGNVTVSGIVGLNTANVTESASNLYYTNARVYANISPLLTLKANVSDLTTANVTESASNLYYTNARVYANVIGLLNAKANVVDLTTANVRESASNLYYTNARVRSNVIALLPTLAGTGISIDANGIISASGNVTISGIVGLNTANVAESASNLYYTNARVLAGLVGQNVDINDLLVRGDLIVQGNTVTLNTSTVIVEDKNLVLANGAVNSSAANGAGFSIDGAQANLTYRSTGDKFEFNKSLDVLGTLTATTVYANVWNNLYTSNVLESASNLYYTNARVYANVIGLLNAKANVVDLTTANVIESASNLYYTNARVLSNVSQMSINVFSDVDTTGIQNNGILIWNGNAFVAGISSSANTATSANTAVFAQTANVANTVLSISNFTTSNLAEGTNLYYSNARAKTALTAGNGISYSNITGAISLSNLVFSNTAPSYPYAGQVWVDTNSGIKFEYIDDGTSSQWVEFGPSGGVGGLSSTGLSSRTTVTGTTASIAANITANIEITGFKGYALYKIGVTNNAWVRVYTTQAARLADSTRSSGIDPSGNAGVIAEIITTGNQTISLSPAVMGYNDEATPNTNIAVAVTNLTTGTTSFTVSLTLIQLES